MIPDKSKRVIPGNLRPRRPESSPLPPPDQCTPQDEIRVRRSLTRSLPLPSFKLKKILVPVDFSQCSQKALQYAIPFARQFDAALTLFNVVPGYLPVPEMGVVDVSLMETQMHQAAERELAALKQRHLAD